MSGFSQALAGPLWWCAFSDFGSTITVRLKADTTYKTVRLKADTTYSDELHEI